MHAFGVVLATVKYDLHHTMHKCSSQRLSCSQFHAKGHSQNIPQKGVKNLRTEAQL